MTRSHAVPFLSALVFLVVSFGTGCNASDVAAYGGPGDSLASPISADVDDADEQLESLDGVLDGVGVEDRALCEETTGELHAFHAQVQGCETDADCNYVEGFYDVIGRADTASFVRTFDCNEISPLLVVANGREVARNEHELSQLQREQEEACRPSGEVSFCQAFDGFETRVPPVCRSGRCSLPQPSPDI